MTVLFAIAKMPRLDAAVRLALELNRADILREEILSQAISVKDMLVGYNTIHLLLQTTLITILSIVDEMG